MGTTSYSHGSTLWTIIYCLVEKQLLGCYVVVILKIIQAMWLLSSSSSVINHQKFLQSFYRSHSAEHPFSHHIVLFKKLIGSYQRFRGCTRSRPLGHQRFRRCNIKPQGWQWALPHTVMAAHCGLLSIVCWKSNCQDSMLLSSSKSFKLCDCCPPPPH